ncbi:MAG: hypothetical protein CVU00_02575 [Bacteroidetes bacterium HGW-Bacteroidetes-17]|jgi:hypothetical protein|nr:MAG: hypothetical protein CVU00_02575 [Bacteroidetes bacterium HGW-Bacteroidetes-17]
MNTELILKLQYSYAGKDEAHLLPSPLIDSLRLISDFFASDTTNKFCLVFPSKEYAAQWLTIPSVISLIGNDFEQFKGEILKSYQQYNLGDKLKLNGKAIVEWVGIKDNSIAFKGGKEPNTAIFSINIAQSFKLQRTDASRQLSTLKSVKNALPGKIKSPLDKLLNIDTFGNIEFIKNKICLVTKYKSYDVSADNLAINFAKLSELFHVEKIDENGMAEANSPLLICNNLTSLSLYSDSNPISMIIIDSFSFINERATDFSDIDAKNIPTILITDMSEIESFDTIGNYGFEFFNFSKEYLNLDYQLGSSPFLTFNEKLKKYFHFSFVKEICQNAELETITQKIHSIEKDESNSDLNTLKIYLIQLTNLVSRISHVLTVHEIAILNQKLISIEELFLKSRMWLGDSNKCIEESILLLKLVLENFSKQQSEKCARLKALMKTHNYDYIICPTDDEAQSLRNSLLINSHNIQVISVADVNDSLLTERPAKAIITGWAKSHNINRILSSFLFSELTVLFYQFENKYYNSLQRRNRKYNENIKTTITNKGISSIVKFGKPKGFEELFYDADVEEGNYENSFDIIEIELKLDNSQFSKYTVKDNSTDNLKAKRIDFEDGFFIYSSETHKFLEINELVESAKGEKSNVYRKKLDSLKPSDVIALINTDRDILVELVEKNTKPNDLAEVKQWTELWRNLLKEYYFSIGENFKKLVNDLRNYDCKKHEVTIRTWLQDENRIGPDDNADLISIALLTNSNLLFENIDKVRESISRMTGWRMKAADFVSDRIRKKIYEFADISIINSKITIEGLGSVEILKVIEVSNKWENIDVRFVNRLLQKEII